MIQAISIGQQPSQNSRLQIRKNRNQDVIFGNLKWMRTDTKWLWGTTLVGLTGGFADAIIQSPKYLNNATFTSNLIDGLALVAGCCAVFPAVCTLARDLWINPKKS